MTEATEHLTAFDFLPHLLTGFDVLYRVQLSDKWTREQIDEWQPALAAAERYAAEGYRNEAVAHVVPRDRSTDETIVTYRNVDGHVVQSPQG